MGSGVISPLNAIVDADAAARHGLDMGKLGDAFLAGGATFIQIRAKQMASGPFLRLAERLVTAARAVNARVIVNDRVDVARLSGAAGVHLGQDDVPVDVARDMLGPNAIIGYSTHSADQVSAALQLPLTYIAVGPVFGTRSKETGYEAVGLELVTEAARVAGALPVVAIGGITLETAPSVLAAGATSVAVISDLLSGGDPTSRVAAYLRQL
jgi:thiamine-phosphate pyrophosphorylase